MRASTSVESAVLLRWASQELKDVLKSQRIASVVGPRQCGKTTLVESCGLENSVYYSLDLESNLQAALQDPGFLISQYRSRCLILDEIQKAPILIGEIKYAVDHDHRCGQFVLTGSSDYRRLPHANESLAGRVDFVRLRTFSSAERMGAKPTFLKRMFERDFSGAYAAETTGKRFAVSEALTGGYPRIFQQPDLQTRARWFRSYLEQQVILDMKEQWSIRREDILEQLFPYLAANSSKLCNASEMAKQLGANWQTLSRYVDVLKAMFVVEELPAWSRKDYDRPGKTPKFFMTDTGLMSHILGKYDLDAVLEDVSYQGTDFVGKLIETWVYNQLMPEIDLQPMWQMSHLRSGDREIDFVVTNENGAILGIEVKASQSVSTADFKHLQWFKDKILRPEVPYMGIVLYAGNAVRSFGNGCFAVPFTLMWGDN